MRVDDLVTLASDAALLHARVGRVHDKLPNGACLVWWGDGRRTVENLTDLALYVIG